MQVQIDLRSTVCTVGSGGCNILHGLNNFNETVILLNVHNINAGDQDWLVPE